MLTNYILSSSLASPEWHIGIWGMVLLTLSTTIYTITLKTAANEEDRRMYFQLIKAETVSSGDDPQQGKFEFTEIENIIQNRECLVISNKCSKCRQCLLREKNPFSLP